MKSINEWYGGVAPSRPEARRTPQQARQQLGGSSQSNTTPSASAPKPATRTNTTTVTQPKAPGSGNWFTNLFKSKQPTQSTHKVTQKINMDSDKRQRILKQQAAIAAKRRGDNKPSTSDILKQQANIAARRRGTSPGGDVALRDRINDDLIAKNQARISQERRGTSPGGDLALRSSSASANQRSFSNRTPTSFSNRSQYS